MHAFHPIHSFFVVVVFAIAGPAVIAQETDGENSSASAGQKDPSSIAALEALEPLFQQIKEARSTRAAVELSAETIVDGAIISSKRSTYQIASKVPGQFTVYLKDEQQRTRIFCDGKTAAVALSPIAFTRLEKPIEIQQAVFSLPVALGPYPEVVLATTLAGVDPALTLAQGMKSIHLIDRGKFRGKTPAIHVRGIQEDEVSWELWLTQDKMPKPLRLQVDLTEMLRANGQLAMPSGYQYVLRFDYPTWKLNTKNDASLFRYTPSKNAKEYSSVNEFLESKNEAKE